MVHLIGVAGNISRVTVPDEETVVMVLSSVTQICSSLNSMNFAKVSPGNKNYLTKTKQEAGGSNILRALEDKTTQGYFNSRKYEILT